MENNDDEGRINDMCDEKRVVHNLDNDEEPKTKRPLSRRHSFSHPLKPIPLSRRRAGSPTRSRMPRPPKLMPKLAKNFGTKAKSPETSLAESLLQLVRQFPTFVRSISDFVFEKQIGQGGFGEVWLANDLRTGKTVAIKELYSETLVGRTLSNFVREIITMARTRNRFCIPFIGFTVEKPFSIITEYMPNGSLDIVLSTEKKIKKNLLSGTHLSMIALGIAHAMRYLHSTHVIHRDIKVSNILLDKHQLPKLADFGIARVESKGRPMTEGIGTVSHMAPELLYSKNYGPKVDVFAFGMTLYEMVEKKNPFAGFNNPQIAQLLRENQRPPLKKTDTPPPLLNLIKMCWDNDPTKRPSAKDIYQMFADGTVYFAGTDKKAVKKLADTLDEEAQLSKSNPTQKGIKKKRKMTNSMAAITNAFEKKLETWAEACRIEDDLRRAYDIPMPKEVPRDRSLSIIRTPQEREEAEIRNREKMLRLSTFQGEETPIMVDVSGTLNKILTRPNDARFRNTVSGSAKLINAVNCAAFCSAMIHAILHAEDRTIPALIVTICTEIINRNKKLISIFADTHFFEALPTETEQQRAATLGFIGTIVSVAPNHAETSLTRPLSSLIKNNPELALEIFIAYVTKFDVIHFPGAPVFVFLQFARTYLDASEPVSARYLRGIYILMRSPKFANFFEQARPIVSAFACSNSNVVARLAIRIMTHLYDGKFVVPFNSIIQLLSDKFAAEDALILLLRIETLPVSRKLYKAIATRALKSQRAVLVLLKYALQQPETALLCSSHPRWLQSESPNTLKVLLAVFAEEQPKDRIVQTSDFADFLTRTLKVSPIDSANATKALFRNIKVTQVIIDRLTHAGYIAALGEIFKTADVDTSINVMFGLDSMARAGYSVDYKHFFERLSKMLVPPNKQTKLAAHVIATLSSHSKIAAVFKTSGLKSFYEKAPPSIVMPKDAEIFLSNISYV